MSRISEEELSLYRKLSVEHTLEALQEKGLLYFKEDPDFTAKKNENTKLFHVSVNYRPPLEIVATGPKFCDRRNSLSGWNKPNPTAGTRGAPRKGKPEGGGAVDLTMYLLDTDFINAVKTLRSALILLNS